MIHPRPPTTRSQTMPANHDVQRTVQASVPAQMDPNVLALTSVLQTTLDLDQQVKLVAAAAARKVDTDGVRYRHGSENIDALDGSVDGHKANYDLVIESISLGDVSFYRDRPFDEADLQQLEALLCAWMYPLRNAITYRQAVERALRDPLTGVQNRNALTGALEREIETSRRHATPLSMLVLDIDRFKKINDTHGHSYGDDVLRAVAQTAGTTIRRCDEIFRFGGEEFVILARYTDEDGARQLAERIRKDIEAIGTVNGLDAGVTVSIGIAVMPPSDSADDLFDRADQALYQAKQQGRNRWVMAS